MQTEGKARQRVLSYAAMIKDTLLRRAVELDGFEEGRHKEVLSNLVEAYGIRLAPEPEYRRPRDPEWAFMVTGFSECIDSFFAFGLFALAKRSGFFPPPLVDTFEPVMQEEGRHILFFVNWVAWHKRNLAWWRRPLFAARVFAVWIFLVWERIGIARGVGSAGEAGSGTAVQDNNFTLTGGKAVGAVDLSVAGLIDVCLEENERRLSGYDSRLLRPNFVPRLMRFARRFMRRPSVDSSLLMKIGSDDAQGALLSTLHRQPLPLRPRDPDLARPRRRGARTFARHPVLAGSPLHRAASGRDRRRLRPNHRRPAGARRGCPPGV